MPFFLFGRKRFDFSGKIKKISILSFLASVRALWVERALRKWVRKAKKWKRLEKSWLYGDGPLGGQKWPEIIKKPHFRKKQSGCFHLKKKSGLQPQNQAFEAWSGAEQIFEFGQKWAWGVVWGRNFAKIEQISTNQI